MAQSKQIIIQNHRRNDLGSREEYSESHVTGPKRNTLLLYQFKDIQSMEFQRSFVSCFGQLEK